MHINIYNLQITGLQKNMEFEDFEFDYIFIGIRIEAINKVLEDIENNLLHYINTKK